MVPEEVLNHFRKAVERGAGYESEWNQTWATYRQKYPEEAAEFERLLRGELPADWDANLPSYTPEDKAMATRKHSEILPKRDRPQAAGTHRWFCRLDPLQPHRTQVLR